MTGEPGDAGPDAGTTGSPDTWDHVVIGGGVVGAATARSLAATGARVLLLEQFARGHDRGSSHGASRIFRMGYAEPEYVALTIRALDAWRSLEQASGRTLLDVTGAVDHGRPDLVDGIADALADAGVPFERLDPDEAAARWPGLRFEGSVVAHASAGRIRSADALEALLDLAVADGAELRFDTPVLAVRIVAGTSTSTSETASGTAPDDVAEIDLAGATVRTASVIAAVGSWAPTLVGDVIAGRAPALPSVRVTQEQPAHFRSTLPDAAWPSFVHYPLTGGDVYGLLTPGEGVKVGFHGTGPVVDPSTRDFRPDPAGLEALRSYVDTWVPGVDPASLTPISCLYDTTPDEDFVIDRTGPLTVATGFSGHGFKFAPLLGDMIADLATGGAAHPRFALGRRTSAAAPTAA